MTLRVNFGGIVKKREQLEHYSCGSTRQVTSLTNIPSGSNPIAQILLSIAMSAKQELDALTSNGGDSGSLR